MPTNITIMLTSADADAITDAYAAQMQTAHDLVIARATASNAWRQSEVARLKSARQAGSPVEVDYTTRPVHERDGTEVAMDEGSALRAANGRTSLGGVKEGEGEAVADPVAEATAAHEAAQAAYGALVQSAIAGREADIAASMNQVGARFAVSIATGTITVDGPASIDQTENT